MSAIPPRPSRIQRALGLPAPTDAEALEARLSMALTAALQATMAKKHLVAAAVALKQGRTGDADALLGQALDALAQAEEETTVVRNTITDRRTAGQKHAARWSPYSQVERTARDPGEILAAIAQSLRQKDAA